MKRALVYHGINDDSAVGLGYRLGFTILTIQITIVTHVEPFELVREGMDWEAKYIVVCGYVC